MCFEALVSVKRGAEPQHARFQQVMGLVCIAKQEEQGLFRPAIEVSHEKSHDTTWCHTQLANTKFEGKLGITAE